MLNINELNMGFKKKSGWFSRSYNRLFTHAKILAHELDICDAKIRELQMELKYLPLRSKKTGRYVKRK